MEVLYNEFDFIKADVLIGWIFDIKAMKSKEEDANDEQA